MEPPALKLLVQLVRIVVLVFALVVALDKFGFQVAPLVAGIGVAGIGIGFALQGVLGNLVAGLTIIFTKPFLVGEYIQLLGVHGQVSSISLSTTTLTHVDQSRVVIPNRKIIGEILHNFGRIRQLHLSVGVAYGTELDRALGVARATALAHPLVLKDPAPVIGVAALADSAITLAVRPWVSVDDYVQAEAELYGSLVEHFRASGIEIPFPQREVRMLGA